MAARIRPYQREETQAYQKDQQVTELDSLYERLFNDIASFQGQSPADFAFSQQLPPVLSCRQKIEVIFARLHECAKIHGKKPKQKNVAQGFLSFSLERYQREKAWIHMHNFLKIFRDRINVQEVFGLENLTGNDVSQVRQIAAVFNDETVLKKLGEISYLDLSSLNLTALPSEFRVFKGLEMLNLSNNYIDSFPEELSYFPRLTYLDLKNNCLPIISIPVANLLMEYLPKPEDELQAPKRSFSVLSNEIMQESQEHFNLLHFVSVNSFRNKLFTLSLNSGVENWIFKFDFRTPSA